MGLGLSASDAGNTRGARVRPADAEGQDTGARPSSGVLGGVLAAPARSLSSILEAERPRWFLWLPVFMGLGIALYYSMASEPSALMVLGLSVMAVSLRIVWQEGLAATLIGAALLATVAGFGLAKIRTEFVRAPVLERSLHKADIRGIVELIEPRPGRGERITLRVLSIAGIAPERTPLRARVRTMITAPGLKPGDVIGLKAKIGPPSAPSLPGDFDFARAAWYLGIGATGYSLTKAEIETPDVASPVAGQGGISEQWTLALEGLRQRIADRVIKVLPGERGAIATALITGARGAITDETNAAFRDSGLFHILSISGLHMVVMAGAAFMSVRRLLALFPFIALRYSVKKWAAAAALVAAFAYLNISGSSVATVRSAVMIGIIFLAVLVDRPALAMRNVAISALLILAVMPESLLDAGFQMSFAAVISLIAVYEVLRARNEGSEREDVSALRKGALFFGGIVMSTLIASFSVAPLAAYHFHKSQQYAVIANLIAIPACNVIVMPAGLLTMIAMPFHLETIPLMVMAFGIDVMVWTAYFVAGLPGAVGHIPALPFASLVLMIAGGLWLTLWQTRWRLGGLAIAAAGLLIIPTASKGDILAGRDGELVAVRGRDGQLYAPPGRHSGFELKRWLESDGDARTTAEAANPGEAGNPWRCDPSGCIAHVRGGVVSAPRHASALGEDCVRADILILSFPKPAGCFGPRAIFDQPQFWAEGTHVVLLDGPGEWSKKDASGTERAQQLSHFRVETVASQRGQRPWTVGLGPRLPRTNSGRKGLVGANTENGEVVKDSKPRVRPEIAVPAAPADDDE